MSNEVLGENQVLVKAVKLQSCDGAVFEVDQDVVSMCATVRNMLKGKSAFRNSLGGQFSIDGSYVILKKEGRVLASLTKNNDDEAIVSLPDVKASTLQKVIEYCKFHNATTATDREKKAWDVDFVQVKQSVLCELASASYYLDIKPLVNLTSRAIATQISGKTSEEIRETFCNINYEAYAPVFASSLAMRCRLQRKFNRKKQQGQEKEQKLLPAPPSESDSRSVDELLEFIGDDGKNARAITPPPSAPSALLTTAKKKTKRTKKKKKNQKSDEIDRKDDSLKQDDSRNGSNSSSGKEDEDDEDFEIMYIKDEIAEDNLEDGFEEIPNGPMDTEVEPDDLDPKMKAALDKEVEEFRQRLESINSQSRSSPKIPLPVSAASFFSSVVGVH